MFKIKDMEVSTNWIVLKKDKVQEKTESGLYLPSEDGNFNNTGTIVKVGPGGRNKVGALIPPPVKIGDRVLVSEYAGQDLIELEEDHFMIRSHDIFAIIKEE